MMLVYERSLLTWSVQIELIDIDIDQSWHNIRLKVIHKLSTIRLTIYIHVVHVYMTVCVQYWYL